MSRLRHADIMQELVELGHEIIADVNQQLLYYRASVYKQETADVIRRKIEDLKLLTDIIGDDLAKEPLRDYDAMVKNQVMPPVPGECSFSFRISRLTNGMNDQLGRLNSESRANQQGGNSGQSLSQNLKKHQRQLMSLCKYGSRQWSFFQTL